jgi:hypothetical protein
VKIYYRKFCRRIHFTNSQQKKLKIKTILIRNPAEIIKSKEGVTNADDTEGLYPPFLPRTFISAWGLYFTILRINMCKQIEKFSFSIEGHAHYVYMCVCKINYYCACRGYVPDNCFKINISFMIL